MMLLKQSEGIKRILILGNTGFIGSHLEEYLRRNSAGIEIIGHSSSTIDLAREEDVFKLSPTFDSTAVVVMCSALKKERGDHVESFSRNLAMSVNLSRLLERYPVRRFLYLSSAAVYGEDVHNTNITEETAVQPRSYYGIAKYASECLYRRVIGGQKGSSLLILRPPLIYGPADSSSAYGPAGFIKKALSREPITLWGDGMEKREFVFIDDLVGIIGRLLFHEYEGVLNIASGRSYSFVQALDTIAEAISRPMEIISKPRTKNKADHVFNNKTLRRLLPELSFTSLEEGVRKMFYVESGQEMGAAH